MLLIDEAMDEVAYRRAHKASWVGLARLAGLQYIYLTCSESYTTGRPTDLRVPSDF